MNIGICCIAYNRLYSLKRLLLSLENAKYCDFKPTLIISIDKSDTDVVEKFAYNYKWKYGEKKVYTHQTNLGLRKHVFECGHRVVDYDALVVLEDDVIVSPFFFLYTIECVSKYSNEQRVAGISLYNFPVNYQTRFPFNPVKSEYDVFMMNCAQSWGQVWMKRQWIEFELWYKNNSEDFSKEYLPNCLNSWNKNSWLKYHTRYCIEKNKFFVYPYESLSTNNNDIGTHVKEITLNYFQSNMQIIEKENYKLPNFEDCFIKYDGFFEPLFIGKYLKIDSSQLCVDLNCEKDKCLYKSFLLTRKILPYKLIKGYGLLLKPLEANLLYSIAGYDLFLYDTRKYSDEKINQNKAHYIEYIYGISVISLIHKYGLKQLFRLSIKRFKSILSNVWNSI